MPSPVRHPIPGQRAAAADASREGTPARTGGGSDGLPDRPRPPAPGWAPYDSRGTRSRVREYLVRGNAEYELCVEGGAHLIRRTERGGAGEPTVVEAGRGMTRVAVLDLWRLIAAGHAG